MEKCINTINTFSNFIHIIIIKVTTNSSSRRYQKNKIQTSTFEDLVGFIKRLMNRGSIPSCDEAGALRGCSK